MIPADHSHAPWRKTILIPFWTIQLGLELIMIALLSLAVGVLVHYDNNDSFYYSDSDEDTIEKAGKVVGPVWIALISACLILTVTEIVLLARKSLKPLTFLITNILKSAIWAVLFVIDIISAVNTSTSRTASAVAILIEAALLLSFWLPLIYASIIYHRFRKGRQYKPVNNPHFHNAPQSQGTDFTQYSTAPIPAYPNPEPYKGYGQQTVSDVEQQRTDGGGRRLSYNHQRDPRFEAYRRTSGGDLGMGAGMSPPVPSVLIQHHDGNTFEMEGGARRELR
ncbi:hypothetical protein ONS95_001626 [Cadophora gregata]|uniref:uncharacterized protein n=1 Tax=Cadophora gregata TaxID=51156 RepID=UPI0026DAD6ED|nr:uncharacterized protein ONS95_001626 [Cadophora gregata]KAK0111254.1 hypothetical protein ONS95_001626 [Cadophora gregata]KAK0112275.1 hypothetical protein ONS96_001523 [Cadophora gregata f. sp. sojae]